MAAFDWGRLADLMDRQCGKPPVSEYRVYIAYPNGRLELGERFTSTSDEQAVALAVASIDAPRGAELEIWAGGRLVQKIPRRRRKGGELDPGARG
jgi:hypothetical protein